MGFDEPDLSGFAFSSLGIHPQVARTMTVLLLPDYFLNLNHY